MLIHGHIMEVDGDQAAMAALVELFVVLPGDDPKAGRTAIENSGEYHSTLRRTSGQWKLVHLQIVLDADPR